MESHDIAQGPGGLHDTIEATTLPLPEEADLEFVGKFVTESLRYLRDAGGLLDGLSAATNEPDALESVQRAFHTIKANAAALHLRWIEHLAHEAESLMERTTEEGLPWGGVCADGIRRTLDMLEYLLAEVSAGLGGREMRRPHGYLELVEFMATGLEVTAEPAPVSGPSRTAGPPAPPPKIVHNPNSAGPPRKATENKTASSSAMPLPETIPEESPRVDVSATLHQSASQAGLDSGARAPISVPAEKLEQLLEIIGELANARAAIVQHPAVRRPENAELGRRIAQVSKLVQEAHQITMSMRMVRLKRVFTQVARHVRDLAVRTGKNLNFEMVGEQIEVDRAVADGLSDPLMHLVRNAIDHGIEGEDERRRSGKAMSATIRLSAAVIDGNVRIEIKDDGKGLDRGRILEKAVAARMIAADAILSDEQVLQLIFAPGFSTAAKVTSLSGRGVGLDAVRRSVENMRGRINVFSKPGKGCTFQLQIPPALTIVDGMLVRVGTDRYIIPSTNVQEVLRPRPSDVVTLGGRVEFVMVRNRAMPLVSLAQAFGTAPLGDPCAGLWFVTGSGDDGCVFLADELLDRGEFVVKPLASAVGKIQGVFGTTVLGDGTVGLILDVGETALLRRAEGSFCKI